MADLTPITSAANAIMEGVELPDRVRHLWRYTDPEWILPPRELRPLPDMAEAVVLPEGPAVLLVAGQAPQLNAAAEACGLALAPLRVGDTDLADLGRAVPADHGYFEALNTTAFNTGLVVRARRNLNLTEPLRVVIPAPSGTDCLPRLLIVAEAGAVITVVEDHLGGDQDSVVIGVTEILIAANAEVRHVLVQRWQSGVVGHLTQRAVLDRDARFLGASVGLGGAVVKTDVGSRLAGPGARSELVGITLAEKRQHLDHHTAHHHTSERTWSDIDFKAAVSDRARSVYTGLIRIEEDAPACEASQENRNLLLSERARIDTIPELEILTDDVSCSHGATVAPVDEEQIFYLQSRGLTADEALRLVVRGFVESTLNRVPEDLRAELAPLVESRLQRIEGAA